MKIPGNLIYFLCISFFCTIGLINITNAQFVIEGPAMHEVHLHNGFFHSRYCNNGIRLNHSEVKDLLAPYPEQLDEYKRGRSQSLIGGIIGSAGLVGLLTMSAVIDENDEWSDLSTLTKGAVIGSFVGTIGGLAINLSGNKKVNWSYKDYMVKQLEDPDLMALIYPNLYTLERKKVKNKEVKQLMAEYPNALKYFKKGNKLSTAAAVIGTSSLAGLIGVAIDIDTRKEFRDYSTPQKIGLISSVTGLFSAIGIAIASDVKKQKAFNTYFLECNCLVENENMEEQNPNYLTLSSTSNGVGLTFHF